MVMIKWEIIVMSLENIEALGIEIVFHNLKNYNSYLIMQELGKCNLEINVIPNGLEKYMSFNINNKLVFIDSF